jgi:hypothetical protein
MDTDELRRTFWSCGLPSCKSPKSPCLIAPQNLVHIKHFSIIIRGHTVPWCQGLNDEMAALREELQTVVDVLQKLNIKLKILEIRYGSLFDSKTGVALSEPFVTNSDRKVKSHTHQKANISTRDGCSLIFARSTEGKEFYEGPMSSIIPIKHCDIFGPIRKLKRRVRYCKLRGDLPSKYLDFMRVKMDKYANPSVSIKVLRAREEKAAAERMVSECQARLKAAIEGEEEI